MAKVLIDIPDIPKNDHQRWVLTHGGIALDGLANGEVMQKMFPQMEIISANAYSVYVEMKECNQFNNIVSFDVDWWNRKWGE